MSKKIEKTSDIRIKVGLDEKHVPVDLKWQASDSQHDELKDCKSVMVSIWDPVERSTLCIDLWTSEMRVDEMHTHYLQTLVNLTADYQKATGSPFVRKEMEKYCEQVAKRTAEWEREKGA